MQHTKNMKKRVVSSLPPSDCLAPSDWSVALLRRAYSLRFASKGRFSPPCFAVPLAGVSSPCFFLRTGWLCFFLRTGQLPSVQPKVASKGHCQLLSEGLVPCCAAKQSQPARGAYSRRKKPTSKGGCFAPAFGGVLPSEPNNSCCKLSFATLRTGYLRFASKGLHEVQRRATPARVARSAAKQLLR
jgi:hypothetical protein